jgi:hypothetical protein
VVELGLSRINKSDVSRHETNNDSSNPTVETLGDLSIALDVPIAALLEPVGSPIPRPSKESPDAREMDARPDGEESTVADYLGRLLQSLDSEVQAEDSVRGDILQAIAVLNRALRRPGTDAAPPASPPDARSGSDRHR